MSVPAQPCGPRRIAAVRSPLRAGWRGLTRAALVCLGLLAATGSAFGFETVLSDTANAKSCQADARLAADHYRIAKDAVETCTAALDRDHLSVHDLAATYVNRGIVLLCQHKYEPAERDFDQAIEIAPDLAGAHMNRGAVLIAEHRYPDAITALDRSIALGTPEPERAFFDRALARERLDDFTGAYYDLL
jgi:tetratricopeptide (TPR) repeat protein